MRKAPPSTDFKEAMAAIREVGPAGHFLGTKHTLEHFENAFFIPSVMDFNPYEQWSAEGQRTMTRGAAKRPPPCLLLTKNPPWIRALPMG